MFTHLISYLRGHYVILDPADSSITLSRRLFRHIARHHKSLPDQPQRVIICHAASGYAFVVNPSGLSPERTALADIQYNDRHRCIGFETLVPTVSRILFDYRLPNRRLRLAVRPCPHPAHRFIYHLLPITNHQNLSL